MHPSGRVLAIDFDMARIGLAISDEKQRIVFPPGGNYWQCDLLPDQIRNGMTHGVSMKKRAHYC